MIVVDIEATGVEANKHSIVSIGAVDFSDPKRQFYEECRIFPGAHVMDEALAVNGFSLEAINDPKKPSDREVVEHFLKWALDSAEHTIAGQNPAFDRDFIKATAERYHLDWPLAHRTIDLHSVCYLHQIKRGIVPPVENKRSNLNSDAIMAYVGLPTEPKPHKAINGARYEAEAFSRLFYDKGLSDEFKTSPLPW